MRDYISREDAVMVAGDMLNSLTGISCKDGENTAREYFRSIPSTDIRKNVRGEWIKRDDGWDGVYYECSVCKEPFTLIDGTPQDNLYNFCPNCGAEMER